MNLHQKRHGLPAILIMLLGQSPLQAASFDCGPAQSPAERLICTTPAISKLDDQLAARYRANLAELSVTAASQLKTGQRAWLVYWPKYCADDSGKLDARKKETTVCVEREYQSRLAILDSQKRIVDGLLAYPVSQYRIMKSKAGIDFVKQAHHTETTLVIDVDAADTVHHPLAEALNQWLTPPQNTKTEDDDEAMSDTESQLDFAASASSAVLSAQHSDYLYGHGAAHPISTSSQSHFYLPSRRPLLVSDVFQGNAWREGLAHLVEKALKQALAEDYAVDKFATLEEMVAQPGIWSFSKDGLSLQFNPYDVAPYAAGAPSVTIPWQAIQIWLRPEFLHTLNH